MTLLKNNLSENEILVHCDFSENHNLKYTEETQSFHFGDSRQQITLHTVVVYSKSNNQRKTECFCTSSESLKHDVPAIWAHLYPVLDEIMNRSYIDTLHFLSDSPATQYRNKTMFSFLCNNLKHFFPGVRKFSWNYHESGHGGGAPDEIGGVCKRTADRIGSQGQDVSNFNTLVDILQKNCAGVRFFQISANEIENFTSTIDTGNKLQFPGTIKIHQVVGSINSNIMFFGSLSRLDCLENCHHYNIGTLTYKKSPDVLSESSVKSLKEELIKNVQCSKQHNQRYDDIYNSSDDEPLSSLVPKSCSSKPASMIQTGSFVLVEIENEKRRMNSAIKYNYVGVCQTEIEEDGEVKVLFLKICDQHNQLFKMDDNDISHVTSEQILSVLPEPKLILKGDRVYY
ncbi:unnamed protein product [Phaedon cochleariae]|uniref:Uncharacterized protein n=1 Tax=Phaedon cochleariae TaxID=80249 RepID=A0A9N9SDK8_PHACE|nr:unnamed protein product [Phaedon cochleariae]